MATLGVFDRTGDQQFRDTLLGNGRSVASTQLAQGQRRIQNAAYSQAASQRGGNPALAMRNAQNAAAAAGAEHNFNQARLRAQEQAQAQQLAQAEDEKRGRFIGGILGGVGAGLGSLAGPAGTVAGGALGAAAGNLVGGNPGGAFGAGLQAGANNLGPALRASVPGPAGVSKTGASTVSRVGSAVASAPRSGAFVTDPSVKAAMMSAQAPAVPVAAAPGNVGDTGIADDMAGGTRLATNQMSTVTQPGAPVPAVTTPAQAHDAFSTRQSPGSGETLVATPQPVPVAQPLAEGRALEPAVPMRDYVPAGQLVADSIRTASPAVPAQTFGPEPVYGNYRGATPFGGIRNGTGGNTPLQTMSNEELLQILADRGIGFAGGR